MPAIEPTEILTEGKPPQGAAVHPFFRLVARAFDYLLFFLLLRTFTSEEFFAYMFRLVPIHFAIWIPVEAALMSLWGSTPGKWLMRIEVKKGHTKRLLFDCSIRRALLVWFRGIGAGIPVINILCILNAYHQLSVLRCTSWDRDLGTLVVHHHLPRWRLLCTVGLTALLCLIYLIRL